MKFGIHLPLDVAAVTGRGLRDFAQRAEELDFDSLWMGDHVAVPRESMSVYPYPDPGNYSKSSHAMGTSGISEPAAKPAPSPLQGLPDALGLLQYVAACTERVMLGTTVLILPMRNPVITAQQVATLDVVSDGRVILGVGVGWNREEFRTLDAPFDHRGARTDDYLEVMRRLWTLDDPSFSGEYYEIGNLGFDPKPMQKPHPTLWIGGNEEPALRRTVRFGGAWHFAFLGADDVGLRAAKMRELAIAADRDPASIAITGLRVDLIERPTRDARVEVEALEAEGVSHLVVGVPGRTDLHDFYAKMATFAREVIGSNRGA